MLRAGQREQRWRRRRRGGGRGGCSNRGGVAASVIAVGAETMLLSLAHRCQLAALLARMLQRKEPPTHTHPQQHTSTAVSERGSSCAAFALALQWSISRLTLVGMWILSETEQRTRASLQPQQHTQHQSASSAPYMMRASSMSTPALV